MKRYILLLFLALSVNAQSSPRPDEAATPIKHTDTKLHADVLKLVELSGMKKRFEEGMESMVEESRKFMVEKCPRCSPEFGKEWKKRFLERTNVNDYVDVYVRAYEKYFTDAEITELIALQKDTSHKAVPSDGLKEKLTTVMPQLTGEAIGECSKIGSKLGAEVGAEIEREHPEYIKPEAPNTP